MICLPLRLDGTLTIERSPRRRRCTAVTISPNPPSGIDLDSSAFAHHWGGLDPAFNGVVVNLRVDERIEVDRLHALACSIGGRSLKLPFDAFWGSRFALVEAPGPLVVGIMSAPDDEHRSRPPDPSSLG